MSYTTIFLVPETGSIEPVRDFRNSHGSAAFIFSKMSEAHLGWDHWLFRRDEEMQQLWDLANKKELPEYERISLATTFDRAMVRRKNIPKVVNAFRAFVQAYPPNNHVCSLLEQADFLEELLEDPKCFAVCWNQTSVSEVWPRIYESDEDDDGRRYDISIDEGHWFIFKEEERTDNAD